MDNQRNSVTRELLWAELYPPFPNLDVEVITPRTCFEWQSNMTDVLLRGDEERDVHRRKTLRRQTRYLSPSQAETKPILPTP